MKEKMINGIVSVLIVLLIVNVWMYFQQPAMTFYPYREFYQTPDKWLGHRIHHVGGPPDAHRVARCTARKLCAGGSDQREPR